MKIVIKGTLAECERIKKEFQRAERENLVKRASCSGAFRSYGNFGKSEEYFLRVTLSLYEDKNTHKQVSLFDLNKCSDCLYLPSCNMSADTVYNCSSFRRK